MRSEIWKFFHNIDKSFNKESNEEASRMAYHMMLKFLDYLLKNEISYRENELLSDRQKYLIEILNNIINDINNKEIKMQRFLIQDLYWNIADFFYDYGNKDENIYDDELTQIMPIISEALKIFKTISKS